MHMNETNEIKTVSDASDPKTDDSNLGCFVVGIFIICWIVDNISGGFFSDLARKILGNFSSFFVSPFAFAAYGGVGVYILKWIHPQTIQKGVENDIKNKELTALNNQLRIPVFEEYLTTCIDVLKKTLAGQKYNTDNLERLIAKISILSLNPDYYIPFLINLKKVKADVSNEKLADVLIEFSYTIGVLRGELGYTQDSIGGVNTYILYELGKFEEISEIIIRKSDVQGGMQE